MKKALSRKNLWDNVPCIVKTALGPFFRRIPPQWFLGRRFRENLKFVLDAQYWPAERAVEYQLARLRSICALAYEKTRFYRRQFDSVGFKANDLKSLDDLTRLPTIDRDTVRDHLDEMCAVSVSGAAVDYVATGGTSGVPLHFYMPGNRSVVEYAYLVASFQRAGYRLGTPMAVFRGRIVPEDLNGLHHEYDPILRHHYYSNFHMTDENIRRYLEHVSRIGPCFLHVYPSSASALTRFVQRSAVRPPTNVLGILAESESVYDEQRHAAEETFNCRYFSAYGHTEKLVLAAECEHSTDYHVWPTYGGFELLDENDHPVTTPGRQGEIVGTGFINDVVPFIRYRTGDYATYVADRCPHCRREHPIIRDVRGHRVQEMLVAHDGSEISWVAMNMHDDTFENVRQFQFYQDMPGQTVLRIVAADEFGDEDQQRILENLNRKMEDRVRITIRLVDEIPLSPRGKAIYVDQRINT